MDAYFPQCCFRSPNIQRLYQVEKMLIVSTNETSKWSLMDKSVLRHVKIQKHPKLAPMKICEVNVRGNQQPRLPPFRVVTGIRMSSQRMATVTRVTSKIMCAQECLHQVAPPCRTAQYD
ncbi:uncharacterized protein LOC127832121 [Dreissena polymorpha]|uniref:uncharacterized protein LOC127832121 n=1 Tax=Dreissena polymorpha TaxID=45954 RepID=UPI0022652502|nr:uncharacterized protein LOC127832121 [Dreissena polymorpha]